MKVLIVEDNANIRAMIKMLVEMWGHTATDCGEGRNALDMYLRHRPNCVLMDIQMSPVDGFTATRTIRQADPEAKIIFVTEHNDPEYHEEARKAGAVGFVNKENLLDIRNAMRKLESRGAR